MRWLDRLPVLPVFGHGRSLQQPVHVSDVAWALVQASMMPCTIDRSLNLSGATALTFNEVVKLTAQALGKQVHLFHLPSRPIVVLLEIMERMGIKVPIKSEQILRLNEHKAFSHDEAAYLLGYRPIGFAEGICKEVKLFRSSLRC